MMDEPMMGPGPLPPGNDLHKLFFSLFRVSGLDEAQAVGDTKNMGIHGDGGNAKGIAQDHIGRLPPHTGKFHQGLPALRHLTLVVI